MTVPTDQVLYCPHCDRESVAETPPCPDGHGALCPDRACVACATALVCDVLLLPLPAARDRRAA